MGITKEQRASTTRASKGKGATGDKSQNRLFNYKPTESEKSILKTLNSPIERSFAVIVDRLDTGCKVSIGQDIDSGTYYIIVREDKKDWTEALAVSVWHPDFNRAVQALAFYLTDVNPDWPAVSAQNQKQDFDW